MSILRFIPASWAPAKGGLPESVGRRTAQKNKDRKEKGEQRRAAAKVESRKSKAEHFKPAVWKRRSGGGVWTISGGHLGTPYGAAKAGYRGSREGRGVCAREAGSSGSL